MAANTVSSTPIQIAPAIPFLSIPKNGVSYANKVVLAPMVRSGELPMRLLSLHYGADLVWGPETVDKAIIGCERKVNPRNGMIEFGRYASNAAREDPASKESILFRIDPEREKGKLIFQVGTASPELAVQAARVVAADVTGIDVNSGCPKPFSTSGGMGAALLRTPDLLCDILRSLVREVGTPYEIGISVKIRLLETPELTSSLVNKLVRTGITGLTIHCRTTPMRPRERAIREQLRMIGDICHSAGVVCLMNGDVVDRDSAVALAAEFGVDGGMIATAAEKNPSVFLAQADGGARAWTEVAKTYTDYAIQCENKFGNTKFSLSQLISGKSREIHELSGCKSYSALIQMLGYEEMLERAEKLDKVLGLDEESQKKVAEAARIASEKKGEEKRARKAAERDEARRLARQNEPKATSKRNISRSPSPARVREPPLKAAMQV